MPYNNTPIAPPKEVSGQVSLPLARVQKIINADPERLHVSKNGSFAIALATEMFIQHLAATTHNVVKAERKPRRNIQYRDVSAAVAKTDNLEFLVDVAPKTTTYKEYKKKQEAASKAKADAAVNAAAAKAKADAAGKGEPDVDEDVEAGNGVEEGDDTPLEIEVEAESANGITDANGTATVPESPPANTHPLPSGSAAPAVAINVAEPEAMDVDNIEDERPDSEPEEDGAAMQIEMEMRGPRTNGSSPADVRRPSGFTAINGR
ncbi:hypothetical protein BDV95DRAFT_505320 [Massariosphaeria phaeospora]|uniref:Transcription factor CBF/NF-Y/archaeal histone domain-containing protein n=1 Tax=Massariosphaeria phaeospora TaxID=100035 RepID=A0A7C8M2L0_9PLEO|nr:hypothetical protein BDV95DRAFT_505320 [Massariosphaeria phaeospora]